MKFRSSKAVNAKGRAPAVLRAGLLAAVWLGSASAALAQNPAEVEVVFRYDRYSSLSFTGFETRLFRIFENTGIPLTVGIVPFAVKDSFFNAAPQATVPLSEEKAALLNEGIEAGILEPALNGFSHQARPRSLGGRYTEFRGLSRDEQTRRIREGKEFLERLVHREVRIFVPPWNVVDTTTHEVLESLGFLGVSSGFDGGGGIVRDKTSLKFLPATADLTGFYEALRSARKSPCPSKVMVVLLRDYDFSEVDVKKGVISLSAFSDLLTSFASRSDVRAVGMAEVMSRPEYGVSLFADNKRYLITQNLIYPWLCDMFNLNSGFYLCESYLASVRPKANWLLAAYIAAILIVCFMAAFKIGRWLFERWPWLFAVASSVTIGVLVFLAYDIQRDADMSYKGMTGLLMFLGFLSGEVLAVVFNWLARKRKFKQGPVEEWIA